MAVAVYRSCLHPQALNPLNIEIGAFIDRAATERATRIWMPYPLPAALSMVVAALDAHALVFRVQRGRTPQFCFP